MFMHFQQARPKPVLYYSRFCQFSNDLVSQLQRANVYHVFEAYCVDGRLHQLPGELRAVPTIQYLDRYYVDDELESFVATIKRDLEASPYDPYDPKAVTSSFSYVEGLGTGGGESASAGFMPVKSMCLSSTLPAVPTEVEVGVGKLADVALEAVEQYRDSEIAGILQQQAGGSAPKQSNPT